MKKKILAMIVAGLICVLAAGCGISYQISYQDATNNTTQNDSGYCNGYFTKLIGWKDIDCTYYIVYANDTKVKYFVMYGNYKSGITPLYNADGTLQVYDGE